ncbi:MAG: arsenate reductase ArsC [candidate division NC10 bacterium]
MLFLCTGNSARSQMAEAFACYYGEGQGEASSAGIDPKGLHPLTVRVMAERGIDVSHQSSKALTAEMIKEADYVITVCGHADQHCPALSPQVEKLHWGIEDPGALIGRDSEDVLAAFRQARDEIERRVRDFYSTLGNKG